MRKDPFSQPRRRRAGGRDLFAQPRQRRRFPWGWLLLVGLLAGGGWLVAENGVQGTWGIVQSLLPASDDSPPPPDPDAPVVPLPLPPPR